MAPPLVGYREPDSTNPPCQGSIRTSSRANGASHDHPDPHPFGRGWSSVAGPGQHRGYWGTARLSTVRSMAYGRHGRAMTASPTHSRRPAFGVVAAFVNRPSPRDSGGDETPRPVDHLEHVGLARRRAARRPERDAPPALDPRVRTGEGGEVES